MSGVPPLAAGWALESPSPLELAFYGVDAEKVAPATAADLVDLVHLAGETGRPLIPAGSSRRAYLGNLPPAGGIIASLRRFDSIRRYEPDDFTISVEAGMQLEDLREVLERQGQELAADHPRGAPGTVGGWLAAALPGPRRASRGGAASSLIGVRALRGDGRAYRGGGRVVKNVAGYDVGKFLVGSLGTAGPILEASFKLRPRQARLCGHALFDTTAAAWSFAADVRRTDLEPSVLMVEERGAGRRLRAGVDLGEAPPAEVFWFHEGNRSLLEWQSRRMEDLLQRSAAERWKLLDEAAAERVFDFLARFLEPRDPLSSAEAAVWASVLPADAARAVRVLEDCVGGMAARRGEWIADALGGQVSIIWGGDEAGIEEPLQRISGRIDEIAGDVRLVYLPVEKRRRWSYCLGEIPCRALAERVLTVFDPAGVFCPGRLLGRREAGAEGAA